MNLFERLKTDLHARRGGQTRSAAADALQVLVGEAEGLQKSVRQQRSGPLEDPEVLSLIQKSVLGLDEAIAQVQSLGRDTTAAQAERALLSAYLPAALTDKELRQAITEVLRTTPSARLDDVIRELQARYRGQYDGNTAWLRIQELLSTPVLLADAGLSS